LLFFVAGGAPADDSPQILRVLKDGKEGYIDRTGTEPTAIAKDYAVVQLESERGWALGAVRGDGSKILSVEYSRIT